jgi:hypothetical protein
MNGKKICSSSTLIKEKALLRLKHRKENIHQTILEALLKVRRMLNYTQTLCI